MVAFIWGADEKRLLIYISSFLTILEIAFFVTQRTSEKTGYSAKFYYPSE
jgi:hypothetical protein|tara:strand:- start:363 stop:512 length:150 start_codon:yes stop_codon:yes gene_type:complete